MRRQRLHFTRAERGHRACRAINHIDLDRLIRMLLQRVAKHLFSIEFLGLDPMKSRMGWVKSVIKSSSG